MDIFFLVNMRVMWVVFCSVSWQLWSLLFIRKDLPQGELLCIQVHYQFLEAAVSRALLLVTADVLPHSFGLSYLYF